MSYRPDLNKVVDDLIEVGFKEYNILSLKTKIFSQIREKWFEITLDIKPVDTTIDDDQILRKAEIIKKKNEKNKE